MARSRKPATKASQPTHQGKMRLYTLEVFIISGPITEKFAKKNPVISRTIQVRGDQTLEDLHHASFDAFGRWEQINVEAIEDNVPEGKFPKVTKKVGKSPPQYADEDE